MLPRRPLIQLTKSGVEFSASPAAGNRLRREFRNHQHLKLKNFFASPLLSIVQNRIAGASFFEKTDEGIATEDRMNDATNLGLLLFVMNSQKLFDAVELITGCGKIGCFNGRVYRFESDANHHDSWHDDKADERRLVGISINLSEKIYSGGKFQIRDKQSRKLLHNVGNTGCGDAVIFRLSKQLEHRVTPVRTATRTVLVGWFQSAPDFNKQYSAKTGSGVTL
jgi:hypothetical protein